MWVIVLAGWPPACMLRVLSLRRWLFARSLASRRSRGRGPDRMQTAVVLDPNVHHPLIMNRWVWGQAWKRERSVALRPASSAPLNRSLQLIFDKHPEPAIVLRTANGNSNMHFLTLYQSDSIHVLAAPHCWLLQFRARSVYEHQHAVCPVLH